MPRKRAPQTKTAAAAKILGEVICKSADPPKTPTALSISASQRIFDILTNPDYAALKVKEQIALSGLTVDQWYRFLTPELVAQAVQFTRSVQHPARLIAVDAKLFEMAEKGSLGHMELVYERVEGYRRRAPEPVGVSGETDKDAWDRLGTEERRRMVESVARARHAGELGPSHVEDGGAGSLQPEPGVVPPGQRDVPDVGPQGPRDPVQALTDF